MNQLIAAHGATNFHFTTLANPRSITSVVEDQLAVRGALEEEIPSGIDASPIHDRHEHPIFGIKAKMKVRLPSSLTALTSSARTNPVATRIRHKIPSFI